MTSLSSIVELELHLESLRNELADYLNWPHGDDMEKEMMAYWAVDIIKEINNTTRKLKAFRNREGVQRRFTDDEIRQARAFPANKLVDGWVRGVAYAKCHDDKRPSLTYLNKTNRLWCPACDKSWNPIDWVMEFEGLTLHEAIRRLL